MSEITIRQAIAAAAIATIVAGAASDVSGQELGMMPLAEYVKLVGSEN